MVVGTRRAAPTVVAVATLPAVLNAKRNEFNALLGQEFGAIDPIFDLAQIESTRPDGSRAYFQRSTESVFTLAPEWTYDGGHLNAAGRRVVAERFLAFLAHVASDPGPTHPDRLSSR
jgi:lysophospholipase L1-like esterase